MKELNRKETILKYIVEEFIKSAEPVGSSTLLEVYELPYSSATIRAEMAELEKMGYLEKTHTSSGRVPSSKGYRYYVDNLRDEEEEVEEIVRNQIATIFETNRTITIDEAIKHGCEIISHLTNLTSVVLGPDAESETMQKIQLVKIDDYSAVAIFVTDQGHVEHNTFVLPRDVTFQDLETVVNIVNDRIVGTPISKVVEKVDAMKPLLSAKVEHFDSIFKNFVSAFLKFTYERMSVYGRDQLFEHKEFTNDLERMRKFVNLLDTTSFWKEFSKAEGINVRIGNENEEEDLDDVSIVSAELKVKEGSKGSISLIGPKRMNYSKVIKAIEILQEQLEKYYDEDDEEKGDLQ